MGAIEKYQSEMAGGAGLQPLDSAGRAFLGLLVELDARATRERHAVAVKVILVALRALGRGAASPVRWRPRGACYRSSSGSARGDSSSGDPPAGSDHPVVRLVASPSAFAGAGT